MLTPTVGYLIATPSLVAVVNQRSCARIVTSWSVQAVDDTGSASFSTSFITRSIIIMDTVGRPGTFTWAGVQGQFYARRAIQQHAPQLITTARLAACAPGGQLAARAIRGEQLVDEMNVLEGARDDKLGQVRSGVVLDHERDGRVMEQAARHWGVVHIIRDELASWTIV